jgi:hypothetical protein
METDESPSSLPDHNQVEPRARQEHSNDVTQGKWFSQYDKAQKYGQKKAAQADQRHCY